MGVGRGDRAALVCRNGPEAASAFLSIASHCACAPLNPAYQAPEFEFCLADLRPRAVVVESGLDTPVRAVAAALGIAVLELAPQVSQPAGVFELAGAETPACGTAPAGLLPPGPGDDNRVALLLHTSGTTSRPKLVPLTHANLSASARNIAESLALTERDRCLNVMPLFHIHGLAAAVLASLQAGGSVVCAPGFVAPLFFGWIEEFRPSWYTAVPTVHQSVIARAAQHRDVIEQCPLRFIRSCSSALAPSLMRELETLFRVPVIEAYGMTEAAHQMASNPLPPRPRKPGSVGVDAGPEVAVMDEAGSLQPPRKTGEVVIRGVNVTPGYADNPEANERSFANGWFRTGDQGYLDDEGYLFLTGRLKEIINRGGEKIAPREIDEALLRHQAVAQAVAFAAPHASLGETVAAAVVLRPGAAATEAELRRFAAQALSAFKVPERILFPPEIPKGPTGKVQRIGLAEKLQVGILGAKTSSQEYVAPDTELETRMAGLFAAVLGVERAGVHDDFFAAGGDSLLAAVLVLRIREEEGVAISLLDFLEQPTVAGVRETIAGGAPEWVQRNGPEGLLVPVQKGEPGPVLFCIPGSDGSAANFAPLARRLGRQQAVGAFLPPAVDPGSAAWSIEELAARYLEEVLAAQPGGDYFLAGSCTGGLVAYELACRLAAMNKRVKLLALFDCYNGAWAARSITKNLVYDLRLLLRRVVYNTEKLRKAGLKGAAAYIRPRVEAFRRIAREHKEERAYAAAAERGVPLPPELCDSRLAVRYAGARYLPPHWPGNLVLFRVEEPRVEAYDFPDMGWRGYADSVEICSLPGSHTAMLAEPNVELVARHLMPHLNAARATASIGR